MHPTLPETQPELPVPPSPQARGSRLRQRLGKRLAALSVVGGLMVVLPLVQVLRYQNDEMRSLAAERAGLDPVARAVDVQRGLLAHRDIAALVLRGRSTFEPERKVRQGEVDDRVMALTLALASGAWDRAVRESDALREDWALLERQVMAHSVSSGESDQAHRLLVEQVLQVIDLISDDATPRVEQGNESVQPTLAVAHALPRLAWRMAQLAHPPAAADPAARERSLAVAEAALARTLGTLNAALERRPRQALADAGASAGAATDAYFHVLRTKMAPNGDAADAQAEIDAAAAAALYAQFALFGKVHEDSRGQLAAQEAGATSQRNRLLGGLALLGLIAGALLFSLWRGLRATDPTQPAGSVSNQGTGKASEASLLLQRLRQAADGASTAPVQRRAEAEPTMPSRL